MNDPIWTVFEEPLELGEASMEAYADAMVRMPPVAQVDVDRLTAAWDAALREAHVDELVVTTLPAPERVEVPGGKTTHVLRYVVPAAEAPSAARRLGHPHPTNLNRKTRRALEKALEKARKLVQRLERQLGYRP